MADKNRQEVSPTAIIKYCDGCKPFPYQDKTYGPNMRLMNQIKQNHPVAERGWRCTVCGKVQ